MAVKNPIKHFHHMALEVSDMEKSIAFYRELFGYRLTERHEAGEVEAIQMELVFLRINDKHHDFVLAHSPDKTYRARNAADAEESPAYFHHLAWECTDHAAWDEMKVKADKMGLEIVRGPVVHSKYDPRGDGSWGENESFYVNDPDGHRLEIFCDMATIADDGVFVSHEGDRIEEAKVIEI